MFKLTREVRLAFNSEPGLEDDRQWFRKPTNSFAGYPSLDGIGMLFTIRVSLSAELDERSQYVVNIKDIDECVREFWHGIELNIRRQPRRPAAILHLLYDMLHAVWQGQLESVSLAMSPFQQFTIRRQEYPMTRLSQKFEFSASHRLHNPAMSDQENRDCFGKCNNPHGHGHNYELQVTLRGKADNNGVLVCVPELERIVKENVIDRFDHRNLNEELDEFKNLIPSVENIAKTIYRILKPALTFADAKLASVTVWETSKTWCEYDEELNR